MLRSRAALTSLPRRAPWSLSQRISSRLAVDALAVLGLLAFAYREQAGRFRTGQYLDLGGPGDWIAHAYRSRLAAHHGLTSWDPAWDRGYPNTDGWQELPNWLTGMVSRVAHTGIPRTMVVLTLLCLLAYPVAGYIALRLLGCGPLAALLGGALLIDNPALYAFVNDYAGIFGLVALPIAVWIVLDLLGRRGGWVGAIGVGLLIELHPFAAVAAAALIAVRLVYDRGHQWRRVLAQTALAVAVAAPYWVTLFNHRPRASDTGNEASIFFADSHFFFRVGLAELSVGAVLLLGAAVVALAVRRLPPRRLAVCCLGSAALMGAGLVLSYKGWLPKFAMDFQLTRSMPFIVVLLAMGLAPLGDLVQPLLAGLAKRWRFDPQLAALGAVAVVVVGSVALAEDGGHWTHEYLPPVTQDAYPYGQDVADWLDAHPDIPRPAVFWAPFDVAAAASDRAFGQVEFTSDYTARGWAVANTELDAFISQGATFAAVEPFLRAEGVQYVYAENGTGYARAADSWLKSGSVVLLSTGLAGRIVGLAQPSPAAFSAPGRMVRAAQVPDLAFYTDPVANAQLAPDIQRWAAVTTADPVHAATIAVQSPSTRTLTVDGRRGDILVVGQRWDSSWEATSGGHQLATERVGPDLLGVDITSDGMQTVTVRHGVSPSEEAGLLLLALGVLGALAGVVADRRVRWRT
jgi:hypothetical protein